MSDDAPKPCPFCGDAKIGIVYGPPTARYCVRCDAAGPVSAKPRVLAGLFGARNAEAESEALRLWNTRAKEGT